MNHSFPSANITRAVEKMEQLAPLVAQKIQTLTHENATLKQERDFYRQHLEILDEKLNHALHTLENIMNNEIK